MPTTEPKFKRSRSDVSVPIIGYVDDGVVIEAHHDMAPDDPQLFKLVVKDSGELWVSADELDGVVAAVKAAKALHKEAVA